MQVPVFSRQWLLVPGLLFMAVFFILPTVMLFDASFHAVDKYGNSLDTRTAANYINAVANPYLSSTIWESLRLSVEVTVICVIFGYVAAYAIVNAGSRTLKAILYAIVISPLLTSVIARSFGWIVILSRTGVVNETLMGAGLTDAPLRMLYTGPATVVAVAQVLMPFAVLPVISTFAGINNDVQKASSILGASAFRTFYKITLPLSMRGVVIGALLVFAHAMGIYITPLVVGGPSRPLMSVRIYEQVLTFFNVPQAAALSFVLLLVTLAVVLLISLSFRSWSMRRLG